MSALEICLLINYALCVLEILGMIFVEHKKPIRITAWSFVLISMPFLGLFVYMLVGYGLGARTKRLLKKRNLYNKKYNKSLQKQIEKLSQDKPLDSVQQVYKDLVMLNLNNSNAIYTNDNNLKYFSQGPDMLESLMQDIKNATKTINILFYIFANDKTGKKVRNLLIEKAKQGVQVRVLYDAVGSMTTYKGFFRKLKKAGGKISEFFPAFLGLKFMNFRANYRNHRKIVVIDGKIGYIGGMNIRNDHMGQKKKVAPWRDCHIRIEGSAVYSLQNIFISDWQLSQKIPEKQEQFLTDDFFYAGKFNGNNSLQIVSSGPTENYDRNIEELMLKMVYLAKKSIKIQTPYFVPDDEFKSALKMAILCGVDVQIMIPKKPDKRFVYYATLSYIKELIQMGAKVYRYDGFLHTKMVIVDDQVVTMGSCNIDIRSFALNFEVNAVMYGENSTARFIEIFNEDITNSEQIDIQFFKKIRLGVKLGMSISRLFSAIL